MWTQGWLRDKHCGYRSYYFDVSGLYQCHDWVLLCSDAMDYCRKVSPLEGNKNRDSLLKKLVCVCVWRRCEWMCIHVCGWECSLLKKLVCVCVGGEGLNVHAFGYV